MRTRGRLWRAIVERLDQFGALLQQQGALLDAQGALLQQLCHRTERMERDLSAIVQFQAFEVEARLRKDFANLLRDSDGSALCPAGQGRRVRFGDKGHLLMLTMSDSAPQDLSIDEFVSLARASTVLNYDGKEAPLASCETDIVAAPAMVTSPDGRVNVGLVVGKSKATLSWKSAGAGLAEALRLPALLYVAGMRHGAHFRSHQTCLCAVLAAHTDSDVPTGSVLCFHAKDYGHPSPDSSAGWRHFVSQLKLETHYCLKKERLASFWRSLEKLHPETLAWKEFPRIASSHSAFALLPAEVKQHIGLRLNSISTPAKAGLDRRVEFETKLGIDQEETIRLEGMWHERCSSPRTLEVKDLYFAFWERRDAGGKTVGDLQQLVGQYPYDTEVANQLDKARLAAQLDVARWMNVGHLVLNVVSGD